jgi:hypothetical protein
MSASAKTEQATSGQIGQPAACMMENNARPLADKLPELWLKHQEVRRTLGRAVFVVLGLKFFPTPYTEVVDNFVGNPVCTGRQTTSGLTCDKTMKF